MKKRLKGEKALSIELDGEVLEQLRNKQTTVLRTLCADRLLAMNIVLKNDRAEDKDENSYPQITALVTWERLDSMLVPGKKVVFRAGRKSTSFRVDKPSHDIFISEDGLMGESINRTVN
jgi:hypothetical protein